ncbi:hypothetical protein [Streptomyces sp. NPDC093261]|uniref:hypothetical protein n=1 Tax=Streptomyces sp. NPDC093261 TaxID=3366037 RepID=UPI00382BE674
MADEQYRWLDGDAAERLLRGEPLEAVDDDARDQAERLAETLAALAAAPAPTSAELPGEAAALAAFRASRTGADQARGALGRPHPAYAASRADDAGLVCLGRSAANGRRTRWGRPLRFGLAAALAAGMIGGVAVAAGTGVLPTPFQGEPGPEASVSAAVSPPQPKLSPTPGMTETDGGSVPPDAGGPTPGGSSREEAGAGPAASGSASSSDDRPTGHTRDWWTALRSSCREVTVGRELRGDRLRALQDAAGGSDRVKTFCKGVLGGGEDRTGGDGGQGSGRDGNGRSGDGGGENGQGGDHGGGGDGGGHIRPGTSGLFGDPAGASPAPISALSSPNPA